MGGVFLIGKYVIITGATSGIGYLLTQKLLDRGAHVLAIGRQINNLTHLQEKYPQLKVQSLDFLNDAQLSEFINDQSIDKCCEIFINCAGFAEYGPLIQQTDTAIRSMIQVNFVNTVIITKHITQLMPRGGLVVAVGSLSANVTTPYGAIYSASKAGLNQVMNAMRIELPHLNFLSVNTGPVNTSFIRKANKGKAINTVAEQVQLDADLLSEQIILSMYNKDSELNLPKWMSYGLRFYQLNPRWIERKFKHFFLLKK